MVNRNVYAVGTSDESDSWTTIAELEKSLNKDNFLPKGYFVNEEIHSKRSGGNVTPKTSTQVLGMHRGLN